MRSPSRSGFHLMRSQNTSGRWSVQACCGGKSEDANTTVGLSPLLCVKQMSGWSIIGNSGNGVWRHSKRTSREDIRPRRGRSGMEMTGDGRHRIQVRRRIPAPRDIVYEAWIDPEGLRDWMCPGDIVSAEATLGVRVGGSFHITMRSKERVHEHVGTYRIVEPPAKLSFTWSGVDNPNEITLVTVEFLDQGDACELRITHERFTKADIAKRYQMGWGTIATKFASFLASNKKPSQKLA